jgi:hypothetical protein
MRVLAACEFSGIVRDAFKAKGHDAWSCDLLPTEREGNHIQDDALNHLGDGWDLMIAHPPCTYLANSGVRWLIDNYKRYRDMVDACDFFNSLLDAPIEKIAVENPIQHKHAREYIRKPDQIIQPWWFGESEMKATCLWLKNLPPLMATVIHTERNQSIWHEPPSPERGKIRSRTFQGIANAMADQWGCI